MVWRAFPMNQRSPICANPHQYKKCGSLSICPTRLVTEKCLSVRGLSTWSKRKDLWLSPMCSKCMSTVSALGNTTTCVKFVNYTSPNSSCWWVTYCGVWTDCGNRELFSSQSLIRAKSVNLNFSPDRFTGWPLWGLSFLSVAIISELN